MPYVFSTLTNSQEYTLYRPGPEGAFPIVDAVVHINGGANLADKHFITPRGAVTEITKEQEAILMKIKPFLDHMEAGFITIEDKKGDIEAVSSNLESRDNSAPLTPQDVELSASGVTVAATSKGKK